MSTSLRGDARAAVRAWREVGHGHASYVFVILGRKPGGESIRHPAVLAAIAVLRELRLCKAVRRLKKKPAVVLCDNCDGCGWYEGGKKLQTKCEKCRGKGTL